MSRLLELRRLTTEGREPDETHAPGIASGRYDFYEFYWAHLMTGNRLLHVSDWFLSLVARPLAEMPAAMKPVRQGLVRLCQLAALFAAAFAILTAGLVVRFEGKPSTAEVRQEFYEMTGLTQPTNAFGEWTDRRLEAVGDGLNAFLEWAPFVDPVTLPKSEPAAAAATTWPGEAAAMKDTSELRYRLFVSGEFFSRVLLMVMTFVMLPATAFHFVILQRRFKGAGAEEEEDGHRRSGTEKAEDALAAVRERARGIFRMFRYLPWPITGAVLLFLFLVLMALSPSFELRDGAVALGTLAAGVFVAAQYIEDRRGMGEWLTMGLFIVAAFIFAVLLMEVEDGQIIVALTTAAVACVWLALRMQYRPAVVAAVFTIGAVLIARWAMNDTAELHGATFTIDVIMPVAWGYVAAFAVGIFLLPATANARFRTRAAAFALVLVMWFLPLASWLAVNTFGLMAEARTHVPDIFGAWSGVYSVADVDD
ncbi:MAG: hypothetical protein MI723_15620, partial [Caulobacterales bacterium]|nr:hypothetical protein [Caulobacterales bacterium]